MIITVVGLNHKTAPVGIRERLAFDSEQTPQALQELREKFNGFEFVLLSTCNRTELYCAAAVSEGPIADRLAKFLSDFHKIPLNDFKDFLYTYEGKDAVSHLLTVACGLDSMVLGETQIANQVKDSYRLACEANGTGRILNRLFHCAFTTSKKVHTGTSISSGKVSVAGVAVRLATQLFEDIKRAKVVVIGAGRTGRLLVQHLLQQDCKDITIINRSYQRAVEKARSYKVKAEKWQQLEQLLLEADIVIASASTRQYLFRKEQLKKIMNRRKRGPLLIIDIAVPRNFEPAVNEIKNVHLYSIDDLSAVVQENIKARKKQSAIGIDIVQKEAANFMDWFNARDIGRLIGQLQEKFTQISRGELQRFFIGKRLDASYRSATEAMVKRIVNKTLHCIVQNINTVAKEHGPDEAAKLTDNIVRNAEKIVIEAINATDYPEQNITWP
jgi:glutamyl-tRNA reductase